VANAKKIIICLHSPDGSTVLGRGLRSLTALLVESFTYLSVGFLAGLHNKQTVSVGFR